MSCRAVQPGVLKTKLRSRNAVMVRSSSRLAEVRAAVIKPDDSSVELNLPTPPEHDADEVGYAIAHRHEIDDGRRALGGFDIGLEDEGSWAVATDEARFRIAGADRPAAVLWRAEERSETCGGVEARPASVYGASPRNQRRSLQSQMRRSRRCSAAFGGDLRSVDERSAGRFVATGTLTSGQVRTRAADRVRLPPSAPRRA